MNEKAIQLFCGIKSDSNHYKENKNSLCIYSLFALFFGVIISLINYYETKNKDIFIYPALFVLVDIFFFLWLKKNKNASTHENYFLFQGFISMAMSLIWMFVAVSNTISKGLGFSYFALSGIVIGVIFFILFFIFRFLKWKKYKCDAKVKEYNNYNSKVFILAIIIILFILFFLKRLNADLLLNLAISGMFVLFFIFFTISVNMFINKHIVHKYITNIK